MVVAIRRRTVYVTAVVAILALAGGFVLAADSILTVGTGPGSGSGTAQPSAAPAGVTFSIGNVVILTENADPTLGSTPATGNELGGVEVAIPSCGANTCNDQFQPASSTGPAETVGDYAQQVLLTVAQACTAPTSGFDAEIAVTDGAGTLISQIDSNLGFSTDHNCQTGGGSGSMVTVYLSIDLGVASSGNSAPTVSEVSVVDNGCSTTTQCP